MKSAGDPQRPTVEHTPSNAPGRPLPRFASYSSGNASGGSALQMLQDLVNRYSSARTQLVQDEEAAAKAHADLLAHNEQSPRGTGCLGLSVRRVFQMLQDLAHENFSRPAPIFRRPSGRKQTVARGVQDASEAVTNPSTEISSTPGQAP